jgi:adenosylcobinamide amidohydrolase
MVESVVGEQIQGGEKPFRLETPPRWLVVRFHDADGWNVLSWALVNGGFQRLEGVAWHYLRLNELLGVARPDEWMSSQMHTAGLSTFAGLLTTRREHAYIEDFAAEGSCRCWSVASIGLSNALRAGDTTGEIRFGSSVGTINLLLVCSEPLTTEAALESIGIASEAKALAMIESGTSSRRSGEPASGTGTDYVVIAWPNRPSARESYAGKHTAIGAAIGRAAYQAVAKGIRTWQDEQPA